MHPALAEASATPYWLDSADRPAPRPALDVHAVADLVVVGGGYSGLWTALLAKERDPDREVVLLEGNRIGWAASGRNGGFCAASLTHGHANGQRALARGARHPRPARPGQPRRDRGDRRPLRHRLRLRAHRRDSRSPPSPTRSTGSASSPTTCPAAAFLDRDAIRAEVDSPTYLAGVHEPDDVALVDPARLAWGLADGCRAARRAHPRAHPRRPACPAPGTASTSAPRADPSSAPAGWRSAPTPSRRSSAGSACTPSRSTTTR